MLFLRNLFILSCLFLLNACATPMLRPAEVGEKNQALTPVISDNKTAAFLSDKTLAAHGGASLTTLNDISLSVKGNWGFIPAKVMPKVADQFYRVSSQERYLPNKGIYSAFYNGPAGTKKVVRTPKSVDVFYNGKEPTDAELLQATAMTSDAFLLFSLGPLGLYRYQTDFKRLPDGRLKDKNYHRIYSEITPGLGFADKDEVVLWIDPKTYLTYSLEVTLKGFKATQNAHVNVIYLEYFKQGGFIIPKRIDERVLAPINAHAHSWTVTGFDINRGLELKHLQGKGWQGPAMAPAKKLDE